MSTRNSHWRRMTIVGIVAFAGAVHPLGAAAQQQQPQISGAAVEVGGVQATSPSGGVAGRTAGVSGAQSRAPVILPNTGTGPMDDSATPDLGLLISAGLLALGAGGYVYRRRSKKNPV